MTAGTRVLVLCFFVLLVGLAGCSHDGSKSADGTAAAPVEATSSGPDASARSDGGSDGATPVREAFIYAAVIERLVKESRSGQGGETFEVLVVLDGAVPGAANPTRQAEPEEPFGHDTKDGMRLLATLGGLPPIEYVATREAAVVGTESGKRPGEARDGGAVVTLGPIEGAENRVEVGSSLWVNGLSGRWQTYVVAQRDGVWKVTGTTGPLAIS
jgi:hypothetical protein